MKTERSTLSRRRFISTLGRTTLLGSLAGHEIARFVHAGGNGAIRLGLVGCGARGSAAVVNALRAGKDVRLVAMADLFPEKIAQSLSTITKPYNADRILVPSERQFSGFTAFQDLLAAGVDAVILATPPAFRPLHFQAAVDAGVHCFLEKPVAVDAPGVRQVVATAEAARQHELSAIVGFQEHFEDSYRQSVAEIQNGILGKITRCKAVLHQEDIPRYARRALLESQLGRPATELEFQLRNWYPFVWLSGDLIVEWLVHQVDTCLWATGNTPQFAQGSAQRREHTNSDSGNLSDVLNATYTFADGSQLEAEVRTLLGADSALQCIIEGEKGLATLPDRIASHDGQILWSFSGPRNDPYNEEMRQWCESIRNRTALNTVRSGADSTLAAILGRTAAYRARTLTWDEVLHSNEALFTHNPKSLAENPPCLPDKFGDYEFPARGVQLT